ncbi:MAG: (2Fe-2S)-binding protein [Sulfolobales archaeon]|nr:(2Fe-2S)-binding protein [Sulfolobales archaeon]
MKKLDNVVIICRCNDVTVNDIKKAIEMGIDDFELLRKYLRLGFGPCQGRSCIVLAARIFARASGKKIDEVLSNYRVRPPIVPVSARYFTRGAEA